MGDALDGSLNWSNRLGLCVVGVYSMFLVSLLFSLTDVWLTPIQLWAIAQERRTLRS